MDSWTRNGEQLCQGFGQPEVDATELLTSSSNQCLLSTANSDQSPFCYAMESTAP